MTSIDKSISILIPCRNEEATITKVIESFRREVPTARIWVVDNNSTDRTAERAKDAGAEVLSVSTPGKGIAVRYAMESVAADIYVMVDGDGTYDATSIGEALREFQLRDYDFSTGNRKWSDSPHPRTAAQRIGGFVLKVMFLLLYRSVITDPLSGLRILSQRFVRSVRLMSVGFELEVEMTSLALLAGVRRSEFSVAYCERSTDASPSKIRAIHDGIRIIGTTLSIFIRNRFSSVYLVTILIALGSCLFVTTLDPRSISFWAFSVLPAVVVIGSAMTHNYFSKRTRVQVIKSRKTISN